jgi:YD repeat-containing protein
VSFTYDAASRVTAQTLPNGVVTEYSYDDASRLTALKYRSETFQPLRRLQAVKDQQFYIQVVRGL